MATPRGAGPEGRGKEGNTFSLTQLDVASVNQHAPSAKPSQRMAPLGTAGALAISAPTPRMQLPPRVPLHPRHALSEAAVHRRAQQKLKTVDLHALSARAQEHYLEVARREAADWLQSEHARVKQKDWSKAVAQELDAWNQQREAAREAEKERRDESERERSLADQSERQKFERRRAALQRKLGNWACDKVGRDERIVKEREDEARQRREDEAKRFMERDRKLKLRLQQHSRASAASAVVGAGYGGASSTASAVAGTGFVGAAESANGAACVGGAAGTDDAGGVGGWNSAGVPRAAEAAEEPPPGGQEVVDEIDAPRRDLEAGQLVVY